MDAQQVTRIHEACLPTPTNWETPVRVTGLWYAWLLREEAVQ